MRIQPHFYCITKTVIRTEISVTLLSVTMHYIKLFENTIFLSLRYKKKLWLEMDSDIVVNKPDKYVTFCGLVYKLSVSTSNISSTIYPIVCLPDLPLAIFQC